MGSANVMIDALSTNPMRGLAGPSAQGPFQTVRTLDRSPTEIYKDGLFSAGHGGITAPQRLTVYPFAQGGSGLSFSLRVYGWRALSHPPELGRLVWLPDLLVELACRTCTQNGPARPTPSAPSPYLLHDDEYLCDTLTLTRGNLGPTGYVNSPGTGTNLIGKAVLELAGCRYFLFDFGQTDAVPMNTLWQRGP